MAEPGTYARVRVERLMTVSPVDALTTLGARPLWLRFPYPTAEYPYLTSPPFVAEGTLVEGEPLTLVIDQVYPPCVA